MNAFEVQKVSQYTRQMLPTFNTGEQKDEISDDDDGESSESGNTEDDIPVNTRKRLGDALTNSPSAKTQRTSPETCGSRDMVDENWYKSKQEDMTQDLNRILMKFKAINLTSLNKIRTIKNELIIDKNENVSLKAKVQNFLRHTGQLIR